MPLIQGKSKKAFSHNVKAEMDAGKPMKQSLAIAYATKRKPKKMNKGGDCYSDGGKVVPSPSPKEEKDQRNLADKVMSMLPHAHAFGGEVQDDVNKTYERDSIDYDSMSDSTHFGSNKDETIKSIPLNEYKSIKNDYPGYWANGGQVPGEEGKALHSRSDLGSHVEMLVDKMLAMKHGNSESEHFAEGGVIGSEYKEKPSELNQQKAAEFEKGFGYGNKSSPKPDYSPDFGDVSKKRDKTYNKALEGVYNKGGRIEEMVDRHMAKKMADGGQIVEDNRAYDDPAGQSDEPWENNSQWKDTDLFSEDQHMNEDMDHESDTEPNKKKKLMSSILAEVRKHNMGR